MVALTLPAFAQDYPNRPITVVVPFPPGASTDASARITQDPMSQALGQPIVIDNRGGAGGTTGAAPVANSKPDGYTLLVTVNAPITMNTHMQKNFPFDPDERIHANHPDGRFGDGARGQRRVAGRRACRN